MTPLKEATAEKHRQAEQMPFNQRMFRGQLSEADYLSYLVQQHAIFETLEAQALPHPDLNRRAAVWADIQELCDKGHPLPQLLPSTQAYCRYLSGVDADKRLAHVYLNYLAILFGGQMMKKMVPSSGKMYEFAEPREAMQAVRAVQQDSWADEVNLGFDYSIHLFDELEQYSQSQTQNV
jgi:heme oxygenase